DGSDLLEAAAKRVADGDAEAPRGIVAAEHLAEHIAKARVDAAADDSRKSSGAQELRSPEAAAAIRRLEAGVGQLLGRQVPGVRCGVADPCSRGPQVV